MDIRTKQFDEQVNRSLYNVMRDLEQDQTRDYLEQDMIESETDIHSIPPPADVPPNISEQKTGAAITQPGGSDTRIRLNAPQQSMRPDQQRERVFLSPSQA